MSLLLVTVIEFGLLLFILTIRKAWDSSESIIEEGDKHGL